MRLATVIGMGVLLGAAGCDKNNAAGGAEGSAATTATSGCGADWGDPLKEFCIKLPKGYAAGKPGKPSSLFSQKQHFKGPAEADGKIPEIDVQVGFPSDPHKSFDEELAALKADMNNPRFKIEGSGPMPGGGMWWQYDQTGIMKRFESWSKTNDGRPIDC